MSLVDPGGQPLSHVAWNLYLAVIPVLLAFAIVGRIRRGIASGRPMPRVLLIGALILWAGFLPNTCYLLTEWRHYLAAVAQHRFNPNEQVRRDRIIRAREAGVPVTREMRAQEGPPSSRGETVHRFVTWTLTATGYYIFYSAFGLLAFFLSVWPLDRLVRENRPKLAVTLKLVIFALCGLGVYLGLVPRYNTWDLFVPTRIDNVVVTTFHAIMHPFVLGVMVIFSVSLAVLYEVFDIFMDGWNFRRDKRRAKANGD